MKLHFRSIKLINFFSFESAEIILDNKGYTLVSGYNKNTIDGATSNGSGKSAIWEGIIWALTGETIREAKEIARFGTTETCKVELNFSVDNNEYKIIRTKNPSNLKIFLNDNDISGKGIRDTKEILEKQLPDLTKSLLGSVVILGQGLPQKFSENAPSKRKEILEQLSKSDFMIEDLKNRLAEKKSEVLDKIRRAEDAKLIADSKINNLNQLINSSNSKLNELKDSSELTSLISEAEIKQKDYSTQCEQLSKLELEKNSIILDLNNKFSNLISNKNSELDSINNVYDSKLDALRNNVSEMKAQKSALELELHRQKSIKDTCPTCGQKLQGVVKPNTTKLEQEISELNESLNESVNILNAEVASKNTEINTINDKYSNLISDIQSNLNNVQKDISKIKEERNKFEQLLKAASSLISSYQAELQVLDSTKQSLLDNITQYKTQIAIEEEESLRQSKIKLDIEIDKAIITKMETALKRDFRGYLLTGIIDYINMKAKQYSLEVFGTDKISFELNGNNISIAYDDKEYENLSGGERQRVDIIIQFALRSMLCTTLGFTSNIICLDELFDNLDSIGCEKVLNLVSKLEDIETIYIITHHASIDIPYDNEIIVVKDVDKISKLAS